MDVKRINDFVRNLDSAINITGITVYGVDDEGHSVKIDTEMLANPKPTFTEASTRTNIVGNGESTTTLWGKVKKWFSDLKTVAFSGSYNDLNNTPEIKTVATTGVFSDLIDKNVSTGTVAFTEASSRTNIATGESQSTLWGKVKKWFTDLKAVAFTGSFADLTTKNVSEGTVEFSATQGVRNNIVSGETLAGMASKINCAFGFQYIRNSDFQISNYIRDSNLYGGIFKGLGILVINGWFRLVSTDIPRYSVLLTIPTLELSSAYPLFYNENLVDNYRDSVKCRTGETNFKSNILFVNRTNISADIYFEGNPTILLIDNLITNS